MERNHARFLQELSKNLVRIIQEPWYHPRSKQDNGKILQQLSMNYPRVMQVVLKSHARVMQY